MSTSGSDTEDLVKLGNLIKRAVEDRTYIGYVLLKDKDMCKSDLVSIINYERKLHMKEVKELEERIAKLERALGSLVKDD